MCAVQPHVHFSGEDSFGKDNDITVLATDDGKVTVHLGFLKLHHKYEVQTYVPREACGVRGAELREHLPSGIPGLHARLVSLREEGAAVCLTVHLLAHKEKLQKEEICLQAAGEDGHVSIIFVARVLGKNKGTPLLKNGIKCIEVIQEDESEASDWPGF
ncbi:adipose-secreted signaling protein isoform X2 [Bacillus rossius redtenbacheri]|uniref:adipose-secreted signaling protein isoform X2 n=1 Tax=Bacillus rossius redtenbacheri TaxID=93214 RepID=UPI002FDEA7B3